jgi:hypothetical protein
LIYLRPEAHGGPASAGFQPGGQDRHQAAARPDEPQRVLHVRHGRTAGERRVHHDPVIAPAQAAGAGAQGKEIGASHLPGVSGPAQHGRPAGVDLDAVDRGDAGGERPGDRARAGRGFQGGHPRLQIGELQQPRHHRRRGGEPPVGDLGLAGGGDLTGGGQPQDGAPGRAGEHMRLRGLAPPAAGRLEQRIDALVERGVQLLAEVEQVAVGVRGTEHVQEVAGELHAAPPSAAQSGSAAISPALARLRLIVIVSPGIVRSFQ